MAKRHMYGEAFPTDLNDYRERKDAFWSHFVGANGEITNVGEGHPTRAKAIRAIKQHVRAIMKPTGHQPVEFYTSLKPDADGVTRVTWE